MTIKIGDHLPEGALAEFIETETEGCALGPNTFKVSDLVKGKKIAVLPFLVRSHQPARPSICLVISSTQLLSRRTASMKSGPFRSMTHLSWALGAAIRKPPAWCVC